MTNVILTRFFGRLLGAIFRVWYQSCHVARCLNGSSYSCLFVMNRNFFHFRFNSLNRWRCTPLGCVSRELLKSYLPCFLDIFVRSWSSREETAAYVVWAIWCLWYFPQVGVSISNRPRFVVLLRQYAFICHHRLSGIDCQSCLLLESRVIVISLWHWVY